MIINDKHYNGRDFDSLSTGSTPVGAVALKRFIFSINERSKKNGKRNGSHV